MKNRLIIDADGTKCWYKNDRLHNENGPAVEYINGDKYWFINGKCHRLDGPAFEPFDGDKAWFYEDQHIECTSQEQFEYLIKLKILW